MSEEENYLYKERDIDKCLTKPRGKWPRPLNAHAFQHKHLEVCSRKKLEFLFGA